MEDAARLLAMFVVIPAWIAAGLADWACHRRTRIEATSGLPENLFHWLLLAEGGVAVLAACLLEINAFTLWLVFGAFVAHEATTFVELRYAVPRRDVRPGEQMVHSFLELLPLALLLLLAATATSGEPGAAPRLKSEPWPLAYLACVAAAVALCNLLPMAEETLRCLRSRTRARPGST